MRRKVALVTGAGRGIGRGIVLELVKNGFDVAGADIIFEPENHHQGLFEVKNRVEELGGTFLPLRADISALPDHQQIIDKTLDNFGSLDVLVNNAGVAPLVRMDILETTPESYDRLMTINGRGPFFLTQRVAHIMLEQIKTQPQSKPAIVFISSISAYVSSPSRAEYCLSKAVVSLAAKIFADRLADLGINVFEVRPGIIQTDMTAVVKEKYDKLIAQGLVPQKRWGFPDDVGKAVAALVSGNFAYSTGLVVEVSGGMNIQRL